MHLLLLSWGIGAVPAFLRANVPASQRPARIGYVSDAAVGMPFAAAERDRLAAFDVEIDERQLRAESAASVGVWLDTVDVVYVAGGETFALLEALQANGAGEVLVGRVRDGLPYIGCSAGSIIAGPSITPAELMDDRAAAPGLHNDAGLGLVDRAIIPHADGRLAPYPPALINTLLDTFGDRFPLLPLRDDQALLVTPDRYAVVAS